MENLQSFELIQELQKRGYYTDLLFSIYDVESILDQVNDDRADDEQIVINPDEFMDILDKAVNLDYITSDINERIENIINDYEN